MMNRGVEIGVVPDLGGDAVLGGALRNEQGPQPTFERTARAQRPREGTSERCGGAPALAHERIERRLRGGGERAPRGSVEYAFAVQRPEVEHLIPDRDGAAERLMTPGPPESGERQILDWKITPRRIRR